MDEWMDEGKSEVAKRREKEKNATPEDVPDPRRKNRKAGWVQGHGSRSVRWRWSSVRSGQGKGPQNPLGSLDLIPWEKGRERAFPALQRGCCPE